MSKTVISAKIVADSISPTGSRLTTLLLVMPRIILSEFNTHRMFSRNSASSRAIPFAKMVEAVTKDPFIPLTWMKDHKGMQGADYLDESDAQWSETTWLQARTYAVQQASILNTRYGLTKQLCNRLLEPYMWHTVLVTATDWDNFFALRTDAAAEIHMQTLANCMLEAMNNSTPAFVNYGEWHLPFAIISSPEFLELGVKCSVARCARISYTQGHLMTEFATPEKDIELHDKLLKSGHMSPFEHQAQPLKIKGYRGNLYGWYSARMSLLPENIKNFRNLAKYAVDGKGGMERIIIND